MVTLKDSWPETDETEIARFEREIGGKLPDDYRLFLVQHNGGRPRPACVFTSFDLHTRQPVGGEMVDWFSPLIEGEYKDLRNTRETFSGRLPDGVLPIARDPGGNLVCLSLNDTDRGTVYFWDHEREAPEGEPADWRNILFVAPSFSAFLSSLREPKAEG